jgi:hypothetical protein
MRLKLGNWAGGAEGVPEGTVAWAGGKTDFNQGPFDMYVQDVSITNYNPADSYEYGDKSGSWQSIKINKDGSSSTPSGSDSSSGSSTSTTPSTSPSSATSATGANSTATEQPEKEGSSSSSPASATSTATSSTKIVYSSLASVEPIDQHTEAAVSVTQTGSMYSTNTASASALNSAISAEASTLATAVVASTQVPDSKPSGNASWTGTSSAAPAEQTTNAGVSLKSGMVGWSVVGLVLGLMLL